MDLIRAIKEDLAQCVALFSGVVLVWSEVILWPAWVALGNFRASEQARRKLNHAVSVFVGRLGGVVVRHFKLEGANSALMRSDGVHLNDICLDIFNMNLQGGIEAALAAGERSLTG